MKTRSRTSPASGAGPIGCQSCDLHEICRLAGVLAFDTGRSRQSTGALRSVPAGAALYRAGDAAHVLYAVRQGMFKSVHISADGDEHVLAIHTPGELLGLEAFANDAHSHDVIAVQPAICCELPKSALVDMHADGGDLGAALVRLLSHATLQRPHLARGPMRQRVTNFLLDLGSRLAARGLDGQQFALGLDRGEIAALLDMRIETVSRILQGMHREKAIEVRGGRVRLATLQPETSGDTAGATAG